MTTTTPESYLARLGFSPAGSDVWEKEIGGDVLAVNRDASGTWCWETLERRGWVRLRYVDEAVRMGLDALPLTDLDRFRLVHEALLADLDAKEAARPSTPSPDEELNRARFALLKTNKRLDDLLAELSR